jgi:hypothetical protein
MWLSTVFTTFSQKDFKAFENLGIGIKASPTLGYGLEAATGLNNNIILRLGVNMTKGINFGKYNVGLGFDEDYIIECFGYEPEFRAKPLLNFMHGNLLLDIHPGGVFCFTIGAFAGITKFGVDGYLVDSHNRKAELLPGQSWPSLDIGDQTINMPDGRASADFRLGNSIKPYAGIGVGRAVAKNKRLAFKFEMGVLYQGNSYSLKQNGRLIDLSASKEEELLDLHELLTESWYVRFWPQISFQLSYRLF